MKKKIKISAVVCARNEESRISLCLKSIKKNNVDEIIVVDGNSTDKTVKISKTFTKRVIISKKKSLTSDRQIGIDAAKNSYIAMIDADHILKKNDINKLYYDLINYDLDIVQGQLEAKNKNNFLNVAEQEAWDVVHNHPGARNMIGTAPCIYKKKIFKYIKFSDKITKAMDDTDFIYRLEKINKFKVGVGKTKIIQYHHANILDYYRKFKWYGYGDAEFVIKHPNKILSIIFHQLFRYIIIYSIRGFFKFKFRSIVYFVLVGLTRFIGMGFYILKKCTT